MLWIWKNIKLYTPVKSFANILVEYKCYSNCIMIFFFNLKKRQDNNCIWFYNNYHYLGQREMLQYIHHHHQSNKSSSWIGEQTGKVKTMTWRLSWLSKMYIKSKIRNIFCLYYNIHLTPNSHAARTIKRFCHTVPLKLCYIKSNSLITLHNSLIF